MFLINPFSERVFWEKFIVNDRAKFYTSNMYNVKDIAQGIMYLKAGENPLSADVGVVKGKKYWWIYDVGANDEAYDFIQSLEGPKAVVISHFHQDHIANLNRIKPELLYVGDYTYTKTKSGIVISTITEIDDGIVVRIIPCPSSHSKGSLLMEVDGKYCFIGDSPYCTSREGRMCYNAGVLLEEIRTLKSISAEYLMLSHANIFVKRTATLVRGLEYIYGRRQSNEPYIYVE